MAQLRQDHDKFVEQEVAVIVVGPENAEQFSEYFEQHELPFTGLPDPQYSVLKRYGQEIKLFKFGRMPAQILIDKDGIARFVHFGTSMRDIPSNEEILAIVDEMDRPVKN